MEVVLVLRKYLIIFLTIIILTVGLGGCGQDSNSAFSFNDTNEFSLFFADGVYEGMLRAIFLYPSDSGFATLRGLLSNATNASTPPSTYEQVLTIISWEDGELEPLDGGPNFPFGLMVAPSTEFVVLREGDNYFVRTEGELFSIDGNAFNSFLIGFSHEYYFYAELPTATIGAVGWTHYESTFMPWESTYHYLAIDGTMRDPVLPSNSPQEAVVTIGRADRINVHSSSWGNWTGVPQSVGTVSVTHDGQVVWQGTPNDLREWFPETSGIYEVEVIADFNASIHYGGTITWRGTVNWEF